MTRLCNCSGRVECKFGPHHNKSQLAEESCKTCGGRFSADGIEPVSAKMFGTVGLEVMNTINPELNWKTVTKGRRSRKSTARILNGVGKASSASPEQFGDYSGSDSDKIGETVIEEPAAGKEEHVPIKKRRHFLRSPSPRSCSSSLPRQGSSSPQTHPCSPRSEEQERVANPGCSPNQRSLSLYSNLRLGEIDEPVKSCKDFDGTARGYYYPNFSGIELLAAAASMDVDASDANKEDHVVENSSMTKPSDASSLPELSEKVLRFDESENCLSNVKAGDNTNCSLSLNNHTNASWGPSGSPRVKTPPRSPHLKVDRRHWDLNAVMDAWDVPHNDTIAEHPSKDVSDLHLEDKQTSNVQMLDNARGSGVESNLVKSETNILESVSPDSTRIDLELTCCSRSLHKEANHTYSSDGTEKSGQAIRRDDVENNTISVTSSGDTFGASVQVINMDAALGISSHKLDCISGMLTSEEKNKTMLGGRVPLMQDEDCPYNAAEGDRSAASGIIQCRDQDATEHDEKPGSNKDVTEHDDRPSGMSQSVVGAGDVKNPQETSEPAGNITSPRKAFSLIELETLGVENSRSSPSEVNFINSASDFGNFVVPGTFNQDGQFVTIADLRVETDGAYIANSTLADCGGQREVAEIIECENTNLPNSESHTCCTGLQCDEPTSSVGKIGSNVDNRRCLDVSPCKFDDVVDGYDLNRFQDGYDSPYEDGELRGLCLDPWDENELEDECVDYESDGRNGDGSDVADYPGLDVVEGGSEGSNGTERSSLARRFSDGYGSKNGLVKSSNSPRKYFMKDDNAVGGKKDSHGGSGTTEQSLEVTEKNNSGLRRRHFSDRRDFVDGKVGEYSSRTTSGKLQSGIEARSHLDGPDGKDAFFTQQCRTRRFGGSYPRPDRDLSADKYPGRYNRQAGRISERDEGQWTYWGSRNRYNSGYQGVEAPNHERPRTNGNPQLDFQNPTSSLSKSFHRPFIRRRSPGDRDESFGIRRRGMLTRGAGSYRSRGGRHPQSGSGSGSREFREDFDSVPGDTAASVRLSRYFSRKEISFSPRSYRGGSAHVPLNCRKSRSRSRTRSPKPWPSNRERNFVNRRESRSPDFRSEARTRAPFSRPGFQSDFGEGYAAPQHRWGGYDRNFADNNNNLRRRRSPDGRMFRRSQRFDGLDSGRLKSGEYLRQMIRPARFSFTKDDGADDIRESAK